MNVKALLCLLSCLWSVGRAFTIPSRHHQGEASSVMIAMRSFSSSSSSTNTAEMETIINQQKKKLLKAVGKENKAEILNAAKDLESHDYITAPISGRWSLVFSTMSDSQEEMDHVLSNLLSDDSLPRKATNAIYQTLFKFLPALAGGQERQQQKEGEGTIIMKNKNRPSPWKVSNEQIVDLQNQAVNNKVDIKITNGPSLRISVRGTATPTSTQNILEIIFTSTEIGPIPSSSNNSLPLFPPKITIPLPRPVGNIQTTFCDDDLRLSRGGRGGIFILKRFKE